jgi:predicted  nucleic acid-binding Zn-ribbon protein
MTDLFTTFLRENPIKTTTTIVTMVVSLIGGVILVDERYAHAADYKQQMTTLSSQLEINRLTSEVNVLQNRKSTLEDKLFEATAKKKPTVRAEQAQRKMIDSPEDMVIERYRSELASVNDQIAKKNELIDKLRTGK